MLFIFDIIVIFMIFIEYRLYRNFITPITLLFSVYLTLINLNNLLIHKKYSFYLVTNESLLNLLFCFVIIFIVSIAMKFIMNTVTIKHQYKDSEYKKIIIKNKKLILWMFYIGLTSRYISLFQTILRYGLDELKGNAFGIFAHIGSMSIILLPAILIIFLEEKRFVNLVAILLVFCNMFIYGGKYVLLINLTYILLTYIFIYGITKKKLLRVVTILLVFTVFVFYFTYVIKPSIDLGYYDKEFMQKNSDFALKHFFYYLLSPVIAMNDFFSMSMPIDMGVSVIFTVPINIFKAVFNLGNYVDPVIKFTVPVSPTYGTNVGGIFSEVIMNIGWLGGILYFIIIFILIYYVFIRMLKSGKSLLLSSYLLSTVLFLFFSNFFTLSGIILNIIYLIFFEFIFSHKFVIRK